MFYIEIEGNPVPWARPGIARLKSSNVVYDKQKREKEMARWQVSSQFKEAPIKTPILLDITFRLPIPESASSAIKIEMQNNVLMHDRKPDIDNLCKFILDAMNGLVYADDRQINVLYARKTYSNHPSTLIRIKPFTHNSSNEFESRDETADEYYPREDRPADLLGVSPEKERNCPVGRKENIVIFRRD